MDATARFALDIFMAVEADRLIHKLLRLPPFAIILDNLFDPTLGAFDVHVVAIMAYEYMANVVASGGTCLGLFFDALAVHILFLAGRHRAGSFNALGPSCGPWVLLWAVFLSFSIQPATSREVTFFYEICHP